MPSRILYADDNQCMRELVDTILSAAGYSMTITEDGQAAWEELDHCKPHLVLLDIEMPRVDGCEVCRRIKNQPETRNTPVILISGRGDTADLAQGAGADAYLTKPFTLDELRGRIHSLL